MRVDKLNDNTLEVRVILNSKAFLDCYTFRNIVDNKILLFV